MPFPTKTEPLKVGDIFQWNSDWEIEAVTNYNNVHLKGTYNQVGKVSLHPNQPKRQEKIDLSGRYFKLLLYKDGKGNAVEYDHHSDQRVENGVTVRFSPLTQPRPLAIITPPQIRIAASRLRAIK